VEDTDLTLEDIELAFNKEISGIVNGLTKISGIIDTQTSMQIENYKKLIVTLTDDVRVILIKIADRLHNMRTMDSMRADKQAKIASETLFLYAPLANRIGLHAIKTELEDLSLKYLEPKDGLFFRGSSIGKPTSFPYQVHAASIANCLFSRNYFYFYY
jgi:GTP pyrophosphokinase